MERVKLDNKRILFNLLPAHVAQHFLMSNPRNMVSAWHPGPCIQVADPCGLCWALLTWQGFLVCSWRPVCLQIHHNLVGSAPCPSQGQRQALVASELLELWADGYSLV
jgi:hypothetical protein